MIYLVPNEEFRQQYSLWAGYVFHKPSGNYTAVKQVIPSRYISKSLSKYERRTV